MKMVLEFDVESDYMTDFLESIDDAHEFLSENQREGFVKLIRNKLKGKARETIKGQQFNNVTDFKNFLRRRYETPRYLYQVMEKIGNLTQEYNEPVLNYGNKYRKLGSSYIDIYVFNENPERADLEDKMAEVERQIKDCFRNGLKLEI